MMMLRTACTALLCWLLAGTAAHAAAPTAEVARLSALTGAERSRVLIDGAKKEGVVNVYTSIPVKDFAPVGAAFEKKYGVHVNLWRASAKNVAERIVREATGGVFSVDVVDTNGPQMEQLRREGLLQKVASPALAQVIPEALMPGGEWTATRLNILTQAYNTKLIKKSELPKRWDDLLEPRWKGNLGVKSDQLDWFATIVGNLGEQKGLALFREIVRRSGISERDGASLLTNLTIAGEVPLALTVYNYNIEEKKETGAPIDWFVVTEGVAIPTGSGVVRRAPHPHAAILFYDFMLTDAQALLAKQSFVVTNKEIKSPLREIPLKVLDSAVMLDQYPKWQQLYNDTFRKSP